MFFFKNTLVLKTIMCLNIMIFVVLKTMVAKTLVFFGVLETLL